MKPRIWRRMDQGEALRVLVYGQSITMQEWWQQVRDQWLVTFPQARLTMESRAIGGFHAARLLRCVTADVLDFAPDLIVLHDYGAEEDYEEIIRIMRARTAADVLVMSDHLALGQDESWHNRHGAVWLPALCRKYGLGLIDVRAAWRERLYTNGRKRADVLKDNVHLNDLGNRWMSDIVWHSILATRNLTDSAETTSVQELSLPGGEAAWHTTFTGCRVDLRLAGSAPALRILLDGAPVHQSAAAWLATSPCFTAGEGRPTKVGYPVRALLQRVAVPTAAQWHLTVTRVIDDGRMVEFSAACEPGGAQGMGDSQMRFVSSNGQIAIEPADWFVRETHDFYQDLPAVQVGDVIRWEVRLLGMDDIPAGAAGDFTLVNGVTGTHSLEIQSEDGAALPAAMLRIF